MSPHNQQQTIPKPSVRGGGQTHPSSALDWLWRDLRDVSNPQVLDCGPVFQMTVDILLRRHAKIHVADLVTVILHDDSKFWDRHGKVAVFRNDIFLEQFPEIPAGSVSAVFGWHLLDLVPREMHQDLIDRWFSYLQPGGGLFCLLREPRLGTGSDTPWWLESLTTLGSGHDGRRPFSYPAITNREMEKLVSEGSVKTFLTRSGRREVLAIKQG